MKLNQLKTQTITAASAAALDTAIAAFVAALEEEKFLGLHFAEVAGTFAVIIVYSPG